MKSNNKKNRLGRMATRDTNGCTKQRYQGKIVRALETRFGPLPKNWKIRPVYPYGLDHGTFEESTHSWEIVEETETTNGRSRGERNFPSSAWVEAQRLASMLPTSEEDDSMLQTVLNIQSPKDPPKRYIRSNDACQQFNAKQQRIHLTKDKFRALLNTHNVEKVKVGNDTYWKVSSVNAFIQKRYSFGAFIEGTESLETEEMVSKKKKKVVYVKDPNGWTARKYGHRLRRLLPPGSFYRYKDREVFYSFGRQKKDASIPLDRDIRTRVELRIPGNTKGVWYLTKDGDVTHSGGPRTYFSNPKNAVKAVYKYLVKEDCPDLSDIDVSAKAICADDTSSVQTTQEKPSPEPEVSIPADSQQILIPPAPKLGAFELSNIIYKRIANATKTSHDIDVSSYDIDVDVIRMIKKRYKEEKAPWTLHFDKKNKRVQVRMILGE